MAHDLDRRTSIATLVLIAVLVLIVGYGTFGGPTAALYQLLSVALGMVVFFVGYYKLQRLPRLISIIVFIVLGVVSIGIMAIPRLIW